MTGGRRWPVAVVAFGLGVVVTAGAAAGLYYGLVLRNPRPPAEPAGPVLTRAEFGQRVTGKTEAEVVAAVGPPDSTSEDADGKYWHYKRRTRDPLTGDLDSDVQVVLKGDKVVAVNF